MNRQLKRMQAREDRRTDPKEKTPRRPSPQQLAQKKRVGAKQFTQEVIGELRKVLWPTRQQVTTSSVIVVIVVVVMTTLIWALDLGISRVIDLVYGS
ncbi:MAG: preprotein translocase subunit SecE [Acidimicrobiia bacterium]|nr:preprotein translocase subunit SecE [Acidimicrobiia bacterium]